MSNHSQPQSLSFAAHQDLLRERLQYFLREIHPLLQADIRRALKEPGKLFSPVDLENETEKNLLPAGYWSLLTFLIVQCISPDIDPLIVLNVAIAIECLMCALDLLDDVEDGDQTLIVQELGTARVLNVSTALLMLAQRALISLSDQGVASPCILRLIDMFQNATLIATAGQHCDLIAEQIPIGVITYEGCREIVEWKAGSLVSLVCCVGAVCAGANDEVCKVFAELGRLMGIAHQLDNDAHDLYYLLHGLDDLTLSPDGEMTKKTAKTDLVRGKKTLPFVLAAQSDKVLQDMQQLDNVQAKMYVEVLHEGIFATWGICLLYRERARDCLQEIEAQYTISPTLRYLLGF